MKTATVIHHVGFEDLGTLAPVLEARGYRLDRVDVTIEALDRLDPGASQLLVVLGGPIGAFDEARYPFLVDELALIRARLAAGKPTLGICLGAQLMARALGARVAPTGGKEIGFAPLTLTAAGRQSALAALEGVAVLHWHGDQFDIPAGAARLAGTGFTPNQAFALGRHALGLQFHPEIDVARLEQWLVGHAGELAEAGIDPCCLRAQAREVGPRLAAAAREMLLRWLDSLDS